MKYKSCRSLINGNILHTCAPPRNKHTLGEFRGHLKQTEEIVRFITVITLSASVV